MSVGYHVPPFKRAAQRSHIGFVKNSSQFFTSIFLAFFPVAGLDDGCASRNPFHDIHPAGVRDAIGERCLDELPVVESEVFFETVHTLPVLQRIFDELGKVKNSTKKKRQRS